MPKSNPGGSPNSYVFPGETIWLDGAARYYGDRNLSFNGGLISGSDVGGADQFSGVAGEDAEAYGESDAMSGSARGGNDNFQGAGLDPFGGFNPGVYPTNEFYGEARLMSQTSRGGNDTMASGVDSYALLVGDARFMLDSSRGGNDVIRGGRAESNWVRGEDALGDGIPEDFRIAGGCNDLFGDAMVIGRAPGEDSNPQDPQTGLSGAYVDNNVIGGNDSITGGDAVITNDLLVDPFNLYNDAGGAFAHNAIFGDAGFMGGHSTGGTDWLRGGSASAGGTIVDNLNGDAPGGEDQLAAVINEIYGDALTMAHHAVGGVDNIRGGDAQTKNSTVFNLISGDAFWLDPDTTFGQNTKTGADVLQGGDAWGASTFRSPNSSGYYLVDEFGFGFGFGSSGYVDLWPTVTNVIAGDAFSMQEEFSGLSSGWSGSGGFIPGNVAFANDVIRGGNLQNYNSFGQVDNYLFGDVGLTGAPVFFNYFELIIFIYTFGNFSLWDGDFTRNVDSWIAGLISEFEAFDLLENSDCALSPFTGLGDNLSDFGSDEEGVLFGSTASTLNGPQTITAGNDKIYGGQGDGYDKLDGSPFGVSNYMIGDAMGMVGEDGISGIVKGGADELYAGNTPGTLNYLIGDSFFAEGSKVIGGNDRLTSGTGKDVLVGDFYQADPGAVGGADTFIFKTNCNDDIITDFRVLEGDKIDLTGFTGGGNQKNDPTYAQFKNFAALLASGRLTEVASGVHLNLDINANSQGGVFILGANLDNGDPNQLTASSFLLP